MGVIHLEIDSHSCASLIAMHVCFVHQSLKNCMVHNSHASEGIYMQAPIRQAIVRLWGQGLSACCTPAALLHP